MNSKQSEKLKGGVLDQPLSNVSRRKIKKLEKENYDLKCSFSFKWGQLFVNAIVKPGKNTILLPYDAAKMVFTNLFFKK